MAACVRCLLTCLFITLSVHDAIGSGTLAKYREWPSWPICGFLQIADELKTHFNADALEQVRLIRDKRTGGFITAFLGGRLSDNVIQVNRGSLLLQSLPRCEIPKLSSSGTTRRYSSEDRTVRLKMVKKVHGLEWPIVERRKIETDLERARETGCAKLYAQPAPFLGRNADLFQCGLANYQQRTLCFRCHAPRMSKCLRSIYIFDLADHIRTECNWYSWSGHPSQRVCILRGHHNGRQRCVPR